MACMEHFCGNYIPRFPYLPLLIVRFLARFMRVTRQCHFVTMNNDRGPLVCPECGGDLGHTFDEVPEHDRLDDDRWDTDPDSLDEND